MWKLGRIAGIDVSIHWTLLLLIAFNGLSNLGGDVLGTVALTTAVFGCVLLHELGHALAARQFGIGTSSIVLLPIGGIASLERMPRNPLQELWIAVAGPLVNVAIAAALFLVLAFAPLGLYEFRWLQMLMIVNVVLVVFNLLPAFPMDGGRVLRSLLALRKPYVQATTQAARIGKYVAIGLGLLGLFSGHFMLVLVAGFVILAGSAESRMVVREFQSPRSWATSFTMPTSPRPNFDERPHTAQQVVWDEKERRYRYVCSI